MEKSIYPNPWKSIWSNPRETIRKIISINPNYHAKILMTLYGVLGLLSISQQLSLGTAHPLYRILLLVIVFAFVWGYLTTSFSAIVVYLTGKLLGGEATWKQIRCVFIWSVVPLTVNLATWIVLIALFGKDLFTGVIDPLALSSTRVYFVFGLSLAQIVFSIWSLVIIINGVAEVQKFSVLRSLGNLLLAILVIALLSLLIFTAIFWTCSPFFHEPTMVSI